MIKSAHKKAKRTPHGFAVGNFQVFMTLFFWFITRPRITTRVTSHIRLNANSRYLFASNHQSILDPFAIFWGLPLKQILAVSPTRFLTAKTVYRTPLMPLLRAMGCYPTRGSRQEIIEESAGYMRDGYSVCFFPEGKRTTQADSEPRPGVSDMIKRASSEFDDIKMILIHIEWTHTGRLRRHAEVSIAEAPKELYKKDATDIMAAIYGL